MNHRFRWLLSGCLPLAWMLLPLLADPAAAGPWRPELGPDIRGLKRALTLKPDQFQPDCPTFGGLKQDFQDATSGAGLAQVEERARMVFGALSPVAQLRGSYSVIVSGDAVQAPEFGRGDIIFFQTPEMAAEAESGVRDRLSQFNPALFPQTRLVRTRHAFGMLMRPLPDEFAEQELKGISDRCLDRIEDELLKALRTVEKAPPEKPQDGKPLEEYMSGSTLLIPGNASFNARELDKLKAHPELTSVSLESTVLTPESYKKLAVLPALERLSIGPVRLRDEGIAALSELTSLRILRLGFCRITDDGLAALRKMSRLEELSLRGDLITGKGFPALAQLGELKDLGLNWNPVTDEGLLKLPPLPKLQTLMLADSYVSDAGLAVLKTLPSLRYVILRRTKVTDASLSLFLELPKLQAVDLTFSSVTQPGADGLKLKRPDLIVFTQLSSPEELMRLEALERQLQGKK